MSVRSSRASDGKFYALGREDAGRTPAVIARSHLSATARIVACAWVSPVSFAGVASSLNNRVFTSHVGEGATGFSFGFTPEGNPWAGARSQNSGTTGVDTFHSVIGTSKVEAAGENRLEWHLLGMYADFTSKKVGVFLDGNWSEAAAPSWLSNKYTTVYASAVSSHAAYDGIGYANSSTTKYTTSPEAHFDGFVSHLWIPRLNGELGSFYGYRIISPDSIDFLALMWKMKLSPRAFMTHMGLHPSYGYWSLSSEATVRGSRYAYGDTMAMTAVGGPSYAADPLLRHVLKLPGIRRFYSLPALPTLSLPTYTPGSLTGVGFRPRVTAS